MSTTPQETPHDPTVALRREMLVEVNTGTITREALEARYGNVWSSDEVRTDFELLNFAAPLVVARRREDGQLGCLTFTHEPRFFFDFVPDKP